MGTAFGSIRSVRQNKGNCGAMIQRILSAGFCFLLLSVLPAAAQLATQLATQQAQELRYLDFTARNDGWAAAQSAALIGSRNQHIVLVSYADPQTTRDFYDIALEFTRPPAKTARLRPKQDI